MDIALAHNDNTPVQTVDRFTVYAALGPVAVALIGGTIASVSFILGAMCLFFIAAAAIIWVFAMVLRARFAFKQKQWHRSALLLAIIVMIVPIGEWSWMEGGDYLHLALMYPHYAAEIRHRPEAQTAGTSFEWDNSGFAGSAQYMRTLVYDPTGKSARQIGRVRLSSEQRIICRTRHLAGNFFLKEVAW